jgi:halocyanin-like protein
MDTYTRRGVLKAGAAGVATLGLSTAVSGQQSSAYGGYLAEEGTWDGLTADATGLDEVTIEVGAAGNNGNFAFAPPVVLVEPGTTVQWQWTGAGGGHNVVHFPQDVDASNLTNEDFFDQFAFNSQTETEGTTISEEGFVYEYTAEETGVFPYVCTPHRTLQMKGVLVVGEDNAETDLEPFGSGGGDGGTALSTVVGGAAIFGGISLAGVAAYRELVGADTE